VLARDVRDIRQLFGPTYEQGLRGPLLYYQAELPGADGTMSKPIREDVAAFLAIAPLPASRHADQAHVERLTDLSMKISPPVSREEAIRLAAAFGPDECFGLAWTLIHLIESAPGGAPMDAIPESDNEWIVLLPERQGRS
jgi:hypothetical protein